MCKLGRFFITIFIFAKLAFADPAGIFLHAYSPEAPEEKIECFEFKRMEKDQLGTRVFLENGRSFVINDYRKRGWIPYAVGMTPNHPDFSKTLKLYEEKATAIPSTRQFLNSRILSMRHLAAEAAKQNEAIAKLPTITLEDGKQLRGCVMTKVETESVTIRHADGIRTVRLSELDEKEKANLSKTSEIWSIENPYITPKDSSDTYTKIVLKNGSVLKNVKFKKFSQGELVFTNGNKDFPVTLDLLPNDRSALGKDVVNLLEPELKPFVPTLLSEENSKEKIQLRNTHKEKKTDNPESPEDQLNLGFSYADGKGVPKDIEKALHWWRKAAEQDYAKAQVVLAFAYTQGNGVQINPVESAKWYLKAAELGLPLAQSIIGTCYAEGNGVTKDFAMAVYWWRKAAEQGDPEAQCYLAISYDKGIGVPMEQSVAIKWFRKAAEQGVAVAQANLGAFYEEGVSVPRDEEEAVMWYRKAADQGYAVAQTSLGIAYLEGKGVEIDQTEAFNWFQKAADQNNPEAQFCMGLSYAEGRGVVKDEAEAVRWWRKAANQGVAEAQAMLGACYSEGKGVAKDQTEASKWHQMAAASGYLPIAKDSKNVATEATDTPKNEINDTKLFKKLAIAIVVAIIFFAVVLFFYRNMRRKTSVVTGQTIPIFNQSIHSAPRTEKTNNQLNTDLVNYTTLIKFFCSNCETKISARQADTGTSAECPTCGHHLTVPSASVESISTLSAVSVKLPPVPQSKSLSAVTNTRITKNRSFSKNKVFIILSAIVIGCLMIFKADKIKNSPTPLIEETRKETIDPSVFKAYMFGYNNPENGDLAKVAVDQGPWNSEQEKITAMFIIMGSEDRRSGKPVRFSTN